jgi:hypothetical protein
VSGHIPYSDAVLIPLLAALVSAVARLSLMKDRKDVLGFWEGLAIGPDLMVGAVVAIPALLAGRSLGIVQADGARRLTMASTNGSTGGFILVFLFLLFLAVLLYDRLFGKEARGSNGWRRPLWGGIVPQVVCGFLALGFALALGTT